MHEPWTLSLSHPHTECDTWPWRKHRCGPSNSWHIGKYINDWEWCGLPLMACLPDILKVKHLIESFQKRKCWSYSAGSCLRNAVEQSLASVTCPLFNFVSELTAWSAFLLGLVRVMGIQRESVAVNWVVYLISRVLFGEVKFSFICFRIAHIQGPLDSGSCPAAKFDRWPTILSQQRGCRDRLKRPVCWNHQNLTQNQVKLQRGVFAREGPSLLFFTSVVGNTSDQWTHIYH